MAADLEAVVEAQWLGGRMPGSRSRESGHESPTYNGTVDGDVVAVLCHEKPKSLHVFYTRQ